jgi:PhnB protein
MEEARMAVKAIPEGYNSLTPYLFVKGAAEALEFYKKAFGATETMRMPGPGGRIMHAEVKIGNSILMLSDENPERGALSPATVGRSTGSIMLYTDDVDATFKRAVDNGAKSNQSPTDMFWGDRMGNLTDPFGHQWAIATHKEDVSPEEMQRRMQQQQPA